MKTGVSTTPWFSVSRPRRAKPSVLRRSKVSMVELDVTRRALQQHRVAVAEESVARIDRVGIQRAHVVEPRERADQHHQRALGQVEVGDQHIDHAEREAGRDEDVGVAAAGLQRTAGTTRDGSRFERAQRRGADRHDAPAGRARACDRVDGALRHVEPLAVHRVLGQVLGAHRLEGAGADVQRDARRVDATLREVGQHRVVEVQRGGGRGDRPRVRREHGLVAALVIGGVGMGDVRRQRHVTVRFEQRERIGRKAQVKQRTLRSRAAEHRRVERLRAVDTEEAHHAARLRRLARAQVHQHFMHRQHALDQRLDRAAARLRAEQARLDHARVVEDQQVTGTQQRGQFAEHAVDGSGAGAIEQTRTAALGGGLLGDEFGRQSEIEIAQRMKGRGVRHGSRAGPARANKLIETKPAGGCREAEFSHVRRTQTARREGEVRPAARAREAGLGAPDRLRAAPADALRRRDEARADREPARWQRRAGRRRRERQRSADSRPAHAGGAGARRARRLGAALPALLPVASENSRGRPARACARRSARRFLRARDGASELQGRGRGRAARDRADAGVPDERTAAAALFAQGGRCESGTCRFVGIAAGRGGAERHAELARCAHLSSSPSRKCRHRRARRPQPPRLATLEVRRAVGAATLATASQARARTAACAAVRCSGRWLASAVARRVAVRVDRRTAPRRRRNRARSSTCRADAPVAAGRRGFRQDGGRRTRGGDCDPRWLAVRADGADRDPRRAALAQAGRLAGAPGHHRRVAHRQPQGQGASEDAGAGRVRRGDAGRRHARGDPGAGAVREAGAGDHRRAASVRRAATARVAREAEIDPRHRRRCRRAGDRAAHLDDERHADPAHAGDDAVRRPRREHDRRAAARPHAGRHQALCRCEARGGDRAHSRCGGARPAGVLGLPVDRGKRDARPAERDRDPRVPHGGIARPHGRSAARPHEGRGEGRGDGAVHLGRDGGAGRDHRDRGRRRCAERIADGDRARRAFRAVATAPAARARRPRHGGECVRADVRRAVVGYG